MEACFEEFGEKGDFKFLRIWKSFEWVLDNWGECEGWYLSNCEKFYFGEWLSRCFPSNECLGLPIDGGMLDLGLWLMPISNSLLLRSVDLVIFLRIDD